MYGIRLNLRYAYSVGSDKHYSKPSEVIFGGIGGLCSFTIKSRNLKGEKCKQNNH